MNKRQLISVVLILAIAAAGASRVDAAWYDIYDFASKGVETYCPFDEHVNDVTGNGNHPTWTGVQIVLDGAIDNCVEVEYGEYLHYTTLDFGASPATWAFWYRPRRLYVDDFGFPLGAMVLSRQETAQDGNSVNFGERGTSVLGAQIWARIGPTPSTDLFSGIIAEEDQWYHVALVFSPAFREQGRPPEYSVRLILAKINGMIGGARMSMVILTISSSSTAA